MAVSFDLDFVTFRCGHPKCGEIFDKSLSELADADDVICPRCGTAPCIDEEHHLLAVARAAERRAHPDKAAR